MKRPTDSRTTDSLPSFLDVNNEVEAIPADAPANAEMGSTASDTTSPPADALSTDNGPEPATMAPPAATLAQPSPRPRLGRSPRQRTPGKRLSMLAMVIGALFCAGSIGLCIVPGEPAAELAQKPLPPQSLLVLGTILFVAGASQRRIGSLQQRLDDAEHQRAEGADALQQSLRDLVLAQHTNSEKPAAGEELQHVLVSMQRQEEKINNLTKAIKMYGKPLMEISGQSTELAGGLAQVKTAVEATNESTRQALARMEAQLRNHGAQKQDSGELQKALGEVASKIEAIGGKAGRSLEPLQQQLGRLDVTVAAMSQRLEDSEVKKSLLRLEDATQKARDEVAVLVRGENMQKAAAQLQDRLDQATTRLAESLGQMRDGNLSGLQAAVRELQREIAGVATAVAQIQASVKGGLRAAATPPAPTAGATSNSACVERTPESASTTALTATMADGKDSATGYQTGTRSSTGKNVFGAIAKLKQMKT